MPPQVSILMAVRNGRRYIAQAIRSVLDQTFKDLELIVWDDGSTDDSTEVARATIGADPRGRVISAPWQGQAKSLNAAAAQTTAPYLGWVDADDWLAPTALEETVQYLASRPQVGMVYTDHLMADAAGRILGLNDRCKVDYSPERLLVCFMTFHFRLMRRDIFNTIGGMDETYQAATDYDLCLRISESATIEHLRRPLYYYRRHSGALGISRRIEQIEASARAVRSALERRGLANELALDVEIVGIFSLRPKDQPCA